MSDHSISTELQTGRPLNSEYFTYYPDRSDATNQPLGDDICLTGISGRYPESDNVEEFAYNLYNGVDMVTESERRWPNALYGLPKRNGTLKDISKFDAQFFGVNPKQAEQMDPQLRLLLEVAYEAIFDSGLNPTELRGTRTGVYIGASSSEALYAYSSNPADLSGYSMTGCATSMLANRLSFFFDFKGPSYTIDTACSSSLVALDAAVQSLKSGYCEYALVAGTNLLTRPQTSLQFQRLGMLSPDGACKSFDASGKGYVRSETVSVVLLQRKSTCRRFYAKVLHSKVNTDGAKEQGITFPSGEVQARLLKEIYTESKIDPCLVSYVEAHGTGTKAGDPQELNSISEIFANQNMQRSEPLCIGSTKSNMGHPEPASGIAALTKILISIQRGVIPANLHFKEPNQQIPALLDGRLKVVDKNSKFNGGLIALNSFGFGGANAHILLQPNSEFLMSIKGDTSLWNQPALLNELTHKPRVFPFCSRTEEGLEQLFTQLEKNSLDLASHCLLEPNSNCPAQLFPYRGFTILNGEKKSLEIQKLEQSQQSRPVWYVFSGMGTQWQGMGKDLLQLDAFKNSIKKSHDILKPHGINLLDIINGTDAKAYERTLNSFVGIASIQIALVDCLRHVGIKPDGIVGHSVGELGCAYADECLSHEETLLAAYYRGKCIEEASLPAGAMAAVGLTWEQCQKKCPEGVVPACHNSRDTVTISGPKKSVQDFVEQLKKEGVFAKEVDSSNVAFHSYYMTSIAPALKSNLERVIKESKLRSPKWVSSSIPEERWSSDLARYSSPDYHVNNLCSAVLFQEAISHIPENAITIEIAPHALLQAILKRSLAKGTVFIPLVNKNASNQLEHVLTQFGRLYMEGVNFDSTKLILPEGLEQNIYPVPVKTSFLSHLLKWDHIQEWNTPKYQDFITGGQKVDGDESSSNTFKYTIDIENVLDDAYLAGHQIDGRIIYPATGYLCLIWESLAKMKNLKENKSQLVDESQSKVVVELPSVVFENVEIHRATILKVKDLQSQQQNDQQSKKINFQVTIMPTNGSFELVEGGNVIVTGQVHVPEDPIEIQNEQQTTGCELLNSKKRIDLMEQDEIYKELRLRGYEYQDEFQPIIKSDIEGTCGELLWTGKWIPFLDAMLQMNVLGQKRGLLLPTRIRTIKIDPKQHLTLRQNVDLNSPSGKVAKKIFGKTITSKETDLFSVLPLVYDPYTKTTQSGGAEIIGLHATVAPRRQFYQPTILERVSFVPYNETHLNHENPLMDNYLNECKRVSENILNRVENVKTQVQDRQAQDQNNNPLNPVDLIENAKLLELLVKAENIDPDITGAEYFYALQKMFTDNFCYLKALEDDVVLNFLNKRTYNLKTVLDTVLENTSLQPQSRQIKILEISSSMTNIFAFKISNLIRTHPQLGDKIDYHLAQATPFSAQDDEYLQSVNKELFNAVEKIDFNIDFKTDQPPQHLKDYDLVILNGLLSSQLASTISETEMRNWLQKCVVEKILRPEGFLFVHEFTDNLDLIDQLARLENKVFRQQEQSLSLQHKGESHWSQLIKETGLSQLVLKSDSKLSTMFLCRGQNGLADDEETIKIDDLDQYVWVETVKIALNNPKLQRVWIISETSSNSGIVGLVNCLRKEFGGEKIRCIFVYDNQPIRLESGSAFSHWSDIFDQIRKSDLVMNIFRSGKWGSFRHVFDETSFDSFIIQTERDLYENQLKMKNNQHTEKSQNSFINSLQRGDLSSLKWIQSPEPHASSDKNKVVCKVAYAALNFRDIMLATGKLSPEAIPQYYKMQDTLLGMEFSGLVSNEKRCMGMVSARGLATQVVVDSKYLWSIPEGWTLEQAATVPVAYSTAYYSLCVRGQLKQGESVLIHAGSGAVGQAAIGIALSYGCKVFVTVSSEEKREYLKSRFPGQLTDESFSSSRDLSFEKHVMKYTKGKGVDLVLNSLSDDKLQASIRVLAQHGRFLEIGKFDLNKNSSLGMSVFLKNVSFHGILLDSLFDDDESNTDWKVVFKLVDEGIRNGVVRPLNSTVFDKNQIEQAFRFMAQGKHIGKVLINLCEQEQEQEQQSVNSQILPRVWFNPTQTYIITGGLGGFGLELAQWMVERGVRNLVLSSRSGVRNGYQARKIKNLQEEFNVRVAVMALDVKNEPECALLVKQACELCQSKKIGGIYHLAALLEDGLFDNQTADRFRRVIDVKYQGALNLDKYTRSNDIMDNSGHFVVFSSVTSGRGNLGQANYGFANSSMERICEQRREQAGKHALAIQWGAIGDVGLVIESSHMNGDNDTIVGGTYPQRIYVCLKTLEHLLLKSDESTKSSDSVIWSSFVPAAEQGGNKKKSQSQNAQKQQKSLVEIIGNILGIKDVKQIRNEQQTLGEMGLDSLMSVEIKQILEQMFNMPLNMKEIQQLTVEKLKQIEQSKAPATTEISQPASTNKVLNKTLKSLMPIKMVERLNQVECKNKQIPMFVVHPIEGHVDMLKEWAEHMKCPLFGLQFTQEALKVESISQLADLYWQQIDKELSALEVETQRIHLCGYSFGASVAFEMALERSSRVASLTLLDGSHSYVNTHVSIYRDKLQIENTNETEAEALFTFYQQYAQLKSRTDFIQDVVQLKTYDHRVKYVVDELIQKSEYQFESADLENAARAFVVKLLISSKYEPSQILKLNELLLIKSNQQKNTIAQSAVQTVLGEDFGLGKVFDGKLKIRNVDGDHRSFLEGNNALEVATVLNEHLAKSF